MVRCLLIDGDARERSRVLAMLQGYGLECQATGEVAEAERYCSLQKPDVVMMESSTQIEAADFLRQMRRAGLDAPVVILYSDTTDIDEMGLSILAGASDFLVKPFDRGLLQFKLKQAGVKVH